MQKWEYFVLPVGGKLTPKEAKEALNQQGESGWELVNTIPGGENFSVMLVFKRPKA